MFRSVIILTLTVFMSFFVFAETANEAKEIAKKAAEYGKKQGKEKGFAEINKNPGMFTKGEVFVFAFDYSGKCLANGGVPKLIGQNILDRKDLNNKLFMHRLIKAAKDGGGWTKYQWMNPVKKSAEWKFSWIEPVNNEWFVGAGIHNEKDVMPDVSYE